MEPVNRNGIAMQKQEKNKENLNEEKIKRRMNEW